MCVYIGPQAILSNMLQNRRRVHIDDVIVYIDKVKSCLDAAGIPCYILFNSDNVASALSKTAAISRLAGLDDWFYNEDNDAVIELSKIRNSEFPAEVHAVLLECLE